MAEATYRGTVYPWQCDHVGHMNIMWYVGKFDEANWELRDKSIRFLHEMRNAETGEIAATCEITAVHLHREEHKSIPFPPSIRETAMKHLVTFQPALA
jgi:acyl-CoA thioester hydrolase